MLKSVTSMSGPISHTHLPVGSALAPSIRPPEFKDAMAKLAFSISIVASRHGDEQLGRTVTSFMPLSAEPPHIMVSIDVRSRLVDLIGLSSRFSISFLSAGHEELGDTFAGKGSQNERFSHADWNYWPSGSPRLTNALLCMDCELVGSIDVGDHMLFVGAITETDICDGRSPLLWNERAYLVPARQSSGR